MSKPYDVTTKELVEADPEAWIRLAGLPVGPTELLNTDLATVSTEADRVLRVNTPNPYLTHIEFQVKYKPDLPDRTLRYNVLVYYQHDLPVQSVIFLMRPSADGPRMTGRVDYATAPDGLLSFRYRIIRVWELPLDELLRGDLAALPLAPLTDEAADRLPDVIRSMESRIQQEATASEADHLWTSTYLLMGVRYPLEEAAALLKGVIALEESVTYQDILAKGEAKGEAKGRAEGEAGEARKLLLHFGRKRLGEPDATILSILQSPTSLERLEQLLERLFEVETWSELLRLTKAGELLKGVRALEELCAYFLSTSFPAFLEESVTYQDILAKGEAIGPPSCGAPRQRENGFFAWDVRSSENPTRKP